MTSHNHKSVFVSVKEHAAITEILDLVIPFRRKVL